MSGVVLYVYCKVETSQHAALLPRARSFQQSVYKQWPGLKCELPQRPEATDGVL